jgi:predicted Zn-dependent protease with MMP-like domain
MSKRAIKRRVGAAVNAHHSLVNLVDRCDQMIEDMRRFGYEPSDVVIFRDLVLDSLHGAEEELSDACTSATLAGITVHVRTREPMAFIRARGPVSLGARS